MQVSSNGRAFLVREEGCVLHAYRCPAGRLTIGVGHTGPDVRAGQVLTQAQADQLLARDLAGTYAPHVVSRLGGVAVSQHQFDALVSLCFNIGTGGFDRSSVLTLARNGSRNAAAIREAFGLWSKMHDPKTGQLVPNAALAARRAREAALYLQA